MQEVMERFFDDDIAEKDKVKVAKLKKDAIAKQERQRRELL